MSLFRGDTQLCSISRDASASINDGIFANKAGAVERTPVISLETIIITNHLQHS